MYSYYLWTIGCQMNFADSRLAAETLGQLGLAAAESAEQADLVILNTCVVRQNAEDKVIGRLSSLKPLKRRNPGAAIVVMGCFVGDVEALKKAYPYVDAFLAPSDLAALEAFAREWLRSVCNSGVSRVAWGNAAYAAITNEAPISASIPIMHGCDHHCTYCIVRIRRGPGRSLPMAQIVAEARDLLARGAKEITLLGQNVDAYGRDLPENPDLADLLAAVHELPGLVRLRFLTSHPAEMSDKLIATVARLPKVCAHFELPVQAGDDQILRRMARGYSVSHYRELVNQIRSQIPAASIATDIIVGFPGETAAQFENTLSLVRELRFDAVHIAAYSPRPGTPAYRLPDDVPAGEKERRRRAIEDTQTQIAAELNAALLGQTVKILVEGREKGRWGGRTCTNRLVHFTDDRDWRGRLVSVRITWAGPWSLLGEVIQP